MTEPVTEPVITPVPETLPEALPEALPGALPGALPEALPDALSEPAFLRAARAYYDASAVDYAARFLDDLDRKPLERALLAVFAESVRADGGGPVLEVGSGPGRITGYLAGLGLDVSGVDLSPRMVDVARTAHPDLRFDVGSMTALDRADGSLTGLVAWYSTIHIPDPQLPGVLAEFHRVLAPGGHALLAFQIGDEPRRFADPFGHDVSLDFHRRAPALMTELLRIAGLVVHTSTVCEPEDFQTTQQSYLLARKPEQAQAGA
jgi:SAM-dependent methyltransferase